MTRREQDTTLLFRYHDGDTLTPEEHERISELMDREARKNARKRPSGGQATAAARQRKRTETRAALGLKKVAVLVPEHRADDIRAIAREMRDTGNQETKRC